MVVPIRTVKSATKKRAAVCQDDNRPRTDLAKHMGRTARVVVRERELGSHREWTDRGALRFSTNTVGGVGSGVPRLESTENGTRGFSLLRFDMLSSP